MQMPPSTNNLHTHQLAFPRQIVLGNKKVLDFACQNARNNLSEASPKVFNTSLPTCLPAIYCRGVG